jgi:hypothetical protein
MHDNLLLRAAKSGQAEDGVQDGKSGGGDVPPPVEGLAQAGMIMRYLPIRRVLKPYPVNRRGVPSLDKLPSVIDTLIKAGRARYAGVLIGAGVPAPIGTLSC